MSRKKLNLRFKAISRTVFKCNMSDYYNKLNFYNIKCDVQTRNDFFAIPF